MLHIKDQDLIRYHYLPVRMQSDDERWCFDNFVIYPPNPAHAPSSHTIVPGSKFARWANIRFEAPGIFYDQPGQIVYTTSLQCIERALGCIDFIRAAADVTQDISEHIPTPSCCIEPLSPFLNGQIYDHMARQIHPLDPESDDNKCEEAFEYLRFRFINCPLILEAIQCLIGFFEADDNFVYQHCLFDTTSLAMLSWRPDPRRYATLDETYSVCASYARTVLKHFFSGTNRDQLSQLETVFLYHQLYYCHVHPVVCVYEFESVQPQDYLPSCMNKVADHRAAIFVERYYQNIIQEVFQNRRAFLVTPSEFIPELHLVPASSSAGTKGWGFRRSFSLFEHFTRLQQQGKTFGLTHELLHQHKMVYPTTLHDFEVEKKKSRRGDPSAKPVLRIHPRADTTKRWFFAQWKKHMTKEKALGFDRIGIDEFTCLMYYYLNRKRGSLTKLDSLTHEVRKISSALKAAINPKKQWFYLKISSKLGPYLSTMRAEMDKMPQKHSHSTFYNKYHTFASMCLTRLK